MAATMMAWFLDELYSGLFHQLDWSERSFIVPKGIESSLTPLMERIERDFPGIKVFSLPSVGDPSKEGIFAQRHIELGVKGHLKSLESALSQLKLGTLSLGYEVHDLLEH